jgi:Xaa-Pro aminopeptidase
VNDVSRFDEVGRIDEAAVRAYRLARLRRLLDEADLAGLVVTDPVNLRYATGSRNMQVWTMHNLCRYAFVAARGPCVLFDLPSSAHLARGLETVDEIRPSLAFDYMMVGPRAQEMARRWAAEIADLLREHGGAEGRLAFDRADLPAVQALAAEGVTAVDGKPVIERAKAVKSLEEIRAFKASLATCEAAVAAMRAAIRPGMREREALAVMIAASVARGGEYPETRLLTSGPRTNPWFQETSDRVMRAGDLLSFDTDLIGPMGFYNDISRSWVVGDVRPGDEQRALYDLSRQQLEHNTALLRPGAGFMDYAARAFPLPEDYLANRYADVAHGCGLGVEYPLIWYPEDAEWGAYGGVFEENMIVCVESYVGAAGGREGVKLEQPVWITADGPVVLAEAALEEELAGTG